MQKLTATTALRLSGLTFGIVALGWLGGTWLGNSKTNHDRGVAAKNRVDHMVNHATELALGEAFPDLMLTDPTARQVFRFRDVLPTGGVLLYVAPGCDQCIGAARYTSEWLARQGVGDSLGVVVADGLKGSLELEVKLKSSGLHLRVYADRDRTLRDRYSVTVNPAVFILDGEKLQLVGEGTWDEGVGYTLSQWSQTP